MSQPTLSADLYKSSRIIPGRFPPPGTDTIADAVRERRGARGLTPLDGALLHTPLVARGFNSLLGAIRTQGKLTGDIRELMILRVGALNYAAFEWFHHAPIAKEHSLTDAHLYVIRDTKTPLPPASGLFTPLQSAALVFADVSTREVKLPMSVVQTFKDELKKSVESQGNKDAEEIQKTTDDLYVEAAMVVASYNMVSRFLHAADVAGWSDYEVPWPVEKKEHFIIVSSDGRTTGEASTHTIHAITITTSPTAPWIVLANSLLTDLSMWGYLIPFFLSGNTSVLDTSSSVSGSNFTSRSYNVLVHSQRGHGLSTLPSSSSTPIPSLATDIAAVLQSLKIPLPVHSVVGVSQGGAAALALAGLFESGPSSSAPRLTKSIVACDTAPRTPAGNQSAWEERIALVYGNGGGEGTTGMQRLAQVTVPRWFPTGSSCNPTSSPRPERWQWVHEMITRTPISGFVAGARGLGSYDTYNLGRSEDGSKLGVLESDVPHVLLVAGQLDGAGKVGSGMRTLAAEWEAARKGRPSSIQRSAVRFEEIPSAGHLPMIDSPENFWAVLGPFLASF